MEQTVTEQFVCVHREETWPSQWYVPALLFYIYFHIMHLIQTLIRLFYFTLVSGKLSAVKTKTLSISLMNTPFTKSSHCSAVNFIYLFFSSTALSCEVRNGLPPVLFWGQGALMWQEREGEAQEPKVSNFGNLWITIGTSHVKHHNSLIKELLSVFVINRMHILFHFFH